MRFIVVDGQSDCVCGDLVEAELDMPSNEERREACCKAAARMVDARRGEQQGTYEFTCFEPSDNAPGYFVFVANEQGENRLRCEACPANLAEVFTHCFYVGHVHRHPQ